MGLCSLGKKRLWKHLIKVFQYLKRDYRKEGEGLFNGEYSNRTGKNCFKQKEDRFRLDSRKNVFTIIVVVRHYKRLYREAEAATCLEMLKASLDRNWSNLV